MDNCHKAASQQYIISGYKHINSTFNVNIHIANCGMEKLPKTTKGRNVERNKT